MTDSEKINRPYLEYDITRMCNMNCLGCSRDASFVKCHHSNFENYLKDLEVLSTVLKVYKFRILGGEPLLSGKLSDYLIAARESGMFEIIGICTNGLLLKQQNDELFSRLDYVDVSIYPGTDYSAIEKELQRRQIINPNFTFTLKKYDNFSLIHLNYDNDIEKTLQIYRQCEVAHDWACHIFEDGYYYKCFKPLVQKNYDEIRGITRHYQRDGVAIHEPELKRRLLDYINDPNPLEHCSSCLGSIGPSYPHHQITNRLDALDFT